MPRIRSIHPEICESDQLAQVSASAERSYTRLWTHLDDEGRGHDRPKLLAARLYPVHDDMTHVEVDRDLEELATAGLLVRYVVDGQPYLAVRGSWDRWQQPHDPKPSTIPPPPGHTIDPVAQMTGNVVRARRTAAGMSLRALAEKLDIDHGYLSRAERGQATLSTDLRAQLVQLLPAPGEVVTSGDHQQSPADNGQSYPQPPVDDPSEVVTNGDRGESPPTTPTDEATDPDMEPSGETGEQSGDQVVTSGDQWCLGGVEGEGGVEGGVDPPLPPAQRGESVTTEPNPRATGTSPRARGTNPRAAGQRTRALNRARSRGRTLAAGTDRHDALRAISEEYADPELRAAAVEAYDQEAAGA